MTKTENFSRREDKLKRGMEEEEPGKGLGDDGGGVEEPY